MRAIVLFLFLFLQFSVADNNLTQKVEETLLELITPKDNEKNKKSIAIIEKAIKKQVEKQDFVENRNIINEESNKEKSKAQKEKENVVRLEKERLVEIIRLKKEKALSEHIKSLEEEKELIDSELSKDNIWASQYLPYEKYRNLSIRYQEFKDDIKEYEDKLTLTENEKADLKHLEEELKTTEGRLSQLNEYKHDPFTELLKPVQLDSEPSITNPLDIITAMSYQKHMKSLKEENDVRYKSLSEAVYKLRRKSMLLQELSLLNNGNKYIEELSANEHKLEDFERTLKIFKTSVETFAQKVSQVNLNLDEGMEKEIKKSIRTGVIILFLLLFFLFVKFLITKYMSDNELFYGINKVANFVFIFLIFIILLFTYLENVENLMTILSFASAGIAIALKDWFMSLLGWVVILVSGSIHVGDRVKFFKDGNEYVGDIVDISVLRMTMHEDVTLTTVTTNKRSGRIIFIPNNYIFTDMIANYSHSGLKTVWDGIEFLITFDSNVSKAQHIAKEVTRKYSKGYTDMTRKQLNRLRSKYSMRNTAVEPRIFSFFDVYGVKISAWYLTNSYATLTLRSTISMEILARLQEEDDIFIALPSQSLYMGKSAPRPVLEKGDEPTVNHRPE